MAVYDKLFTVAKIFSYPECTLSDRLKLQIQFTRNGQLNFHPFGGLTGMARGCNFAVKLCDKYQPPRKGHKRKIMGYNCCMTN